MKKRDLVAIVLVFGTLAHEAKHLPVDMYYSHDSLTPQIVDVDSVPFLSSLSKSTPEGGA